jgi:glutathione-regulated potassium-efflux system ancillary protein KefG
MKAPHAMRRILVLFAHPALEKSRVNRRLIRRADEADVTFNDLYEHYPDFDVDVAREQQLLVAHDVVVFQHPLYWYSVPALLKQWIDLVLEHGWAYGSGGDALRGKWLVNAITAGGGQAAYTPEGLNRHTLRQMLAPIEQTAWLCWMKFLPPYVVHGAHTLEKSDIEQHAHGYQRFIRALRNPSVDLEALRAGDYFALPPETPGG